MIGLEFLRQFVFPFSLDLTKIAQDRKIWCSMQELLREGSVAQWVSLSGPQLKFLASAGRVKREIVSETLENYCQFVLTILS